MVLLSLRRRKKHGPTLPSRLAGVAEDCLLRLVRRLDALLERRRMRFDLVFVGMGVAPEGVAETLLLLVSRTAASAIGLVLLTQLLPREVVLDLRFSTDSGSSKRDGLSSSLDFKGSGEA